MVQTMQFNREKMRAVILRTCHACASEQLGAVKLNKVLYFLDMISYATNGLSVTGATYRKRPFGPTTDQVLGVLRDMKASGDIDIKEDNFHGYTKKNYIPLVSEPDHVLNEGEQSLLDDVIEFVCRENTAREISEFSHQLPWEMAESGGVIEYYTSLLLFPSIPSPEAFDIISKGRAEIEDTRSNVKTLATSDYATFRNRISNEARVL